MPPPETSPFGSDGGGSKDCAVRSGDGRRSRGGGVGGFSVRLLLSSPSSPSLSSCSKSSRPVSYADVIDAVSSSFSIPFACGCAAVAAGVDIDGDDDDPAGLGFGVRVGAEGERRVGVEGPAAGRVAALPAAAAATAGLALRGVDAFEE